MNKKINLLINITFLLGFSCIHSIQAATQKCVREPNSSYDICVDVVEKSEPTTESSATREEPVEEPVSEEPSTEPVTTPEPEPQNPATPENPVVSDKTPDQTPTTPVVTNPQPNPTPPAITPPVTPVVTAPAIPQPPNPAAPTTVITAKLHTFVQENRGQWTGFYFVLPPLPQTGNVSAARLRFVNSRDDEQVTGQLNMYADAADNPVFFEQAADLPSKRTLTQSSAHLTPNHSSARLQTWSLDVTAPVHEVLQLNRCQRQVVLIGKATNATQPNFARYTVNETVLTLELSFQGQQSIPTQYPSTCFVNATTLSQINQVPELAQAGLNLQWVSSDLLGGNMQTNDIYALLQPLALSQSRSLHQNRTLVWEAGEVTFHLDNGQSLQAVGVIQDMLEFKQALQQWGTPTVSVQADGSLQVIVQRYSANDLKYKVLPDVISTLAPRTASLGIHTNNNQVWFVFLDHAGVKRQQQLFVNSL